MDSFLSGMIPLYAKAEPLAIAHQQSRIFHHPYYVVRHPGLDGLIGGPWAVSHVKPELAPCDEPGSVICCHDGREFFA